MRYKITKRVLIFWCLFIGIGALIGSTSMFIDHTGKINHFIISHRSSLRKYIYRMV